MPKDVTNFLHMIFGDLVKGKVLKVLLRNEIWQLSGVFGYAASKGFQETWFVDCFPRVITGKSIFSCFFVGLGLFGN